MGNAFEKIQDEVLHEIVGRLASRFRPSKVFLFGSRATGNARPDSDYDLFLVVKESDLLPFQRMQEAHRLLWDFHRAVDVFIFTEAEFDEWKDDFGSVANTVATEGVELNVG